MHATLSPIGSRDRPMPVTTTAVIEPRVKRSHCPHCGGEFRLLDHEAPAPALRRVDVMCRQCSAPRSFWFRVLRTDLN
jgi:hypothetical protein